MNTPGFDDYFLKGEYERDINSANNKGVASEYARLLATVRANSSSGAQDTY